MKKDQLVFLLGGLAFGFLFGFGVYHTWYAAPNLDGHAQAAAATPAASMTTGAPPAGQPMGQANSAAPMVGEINQLKRMIQDDPGNVAAFVRLGNLHYDVQMWQQAEGYYESALELQPNDPDVMTDLGVCYREQGKFEKALDMFEGANLVNPNHHQSLFNVVVVAGFDLKQWDRAEEALEALEAMNPKPPRIAELRAAIERQRAASGG